MPLGPIEIVTIGFEHGRFNGSIIPELRRLVDAGIVSMVDGIAVRKLGEHSVEIIEFDGAEDDPAIAELAQLFDRIDGLLSEEDADELIEDLPVGAAAAILCFEHTWVVPLRDAIVAAGGEFLETIRVPGPVADEVLAAAREAESAEKEN